MNEIDKESNEILIVDDNPENLRVLSTMLKKEGYKIRVAKNGKQALDSIAALEPDIILLDVHMPEMGGFEVCKMLKANKKTEHIPIIFLSALNDTFNKLQAFSAGAVDYITKPFELEEVKVRVKTHLQLRFCRIEAENLRKLLAEKEAELQKLKSEGL
jgi:PleD family two-component response regulator